MYFVVVEVVVKAVQKGETPDIQSHGQVGNAVSMLATDQIFPVLYFIDPNNLKSKINQKTVS